MKRRSSNMSSIINWTISELRPLNLYRMTGMAPKVPPTQMLKSMPTSTDKQALNLSLMMLTWLDKTIIICGGNCKCKEKISDLTDQWISSVAAPSKEMALASKESWSDRSETTPSSTLKSFEFFTTSTINMKYYNHWHYERFMTQIITIIDRH